MSEYIFVLPRCKTCAEPVSHLFDQFTQMINSKISPERALDQLGLSLPCCRESLISPSKYTYQTYKAPPQLSSPNKLPALNVDLGRGVATSQTAINSSSLSTEQSTRVPSLVGVEMGEGISIIPTVEEVGKKASFDYPKAPGVPTINQIPGYSDVVINLVGGMQTVKTTGCTFMCRF